MLNLDFDGELFHAVSRRPQFGCCPIIAGSEIAIGHQFNPFCAHFENAVEFDIYENDRNGKIAAIDLLRRIKLRTATVDDLPDKAHDIAYHFLKFAREIIYENVRLEVNEQLPSRQRCLWACQSYEQAVDWGVRCGAKAIALIHARGSIVDLDASLLMNESEPYSETIARAKKYWLGERSDKPEMEVLLVGMARVIEIAPLTAP